VKVAKADPSGYSEAFYRSLDATAEVAARRILPLVFDLVSVHSVVDVGCGDGGWLAVAQACGVSEVLGIEGPWIEREQLKIPPRRIHRARLDQPFAIDRCFDLAISLEVAEHLPADRATGFVVELTRLAPVVLFSAAIPGQRGVHHRNEQWPAYWAQLFAAQGYRTIDILRFRIWTDPMVAFWYKQNLLLFASDSALSKNPELARAALGCSNEPIALIHPDLFCSTLRLARPRLGRWLKMAPQVFKRTLRTTTAEN
jgi:SAM-dependent methyltransferase